MALSKPVLDSLSRFGGTAIFVGGTSGIGRSTAFQLASHASHPCSIILVGRDKDRATSAIERMKASSKVDHVYAFEACDVTSFREVRELTSRLKERTKRVDLLVLTCGFLSLAGRKENAEGADVKMAAHFYSRMLIINDLLPLLDHPTTTDGPTGQEAGARVVSVLDSVYGPGKLDWDDLELKRTFSASKCARHTTTMTNVQFEHLALTHPTLSFIHVFPGWVTTPIFTTFLSPRLRPLLRLANPLISLVATSPDDYGLVLLKALFDPRYEKGMWKLDSKSEAVGKGKAAAGDEARSKVSSHVDEVTNRGR